jgi:hypothetical protein
LIGAIIAELALVFAAFNRLSTGGDGHVLRLCRLNGFTLSVIFLAYELAVLCWPLQ